MLTQTIENTKQTLFIVTVALIVSGIGVMGGVLFSKYMEDRAFHVPIAHSHPSRNVEHITETTAEPLFNTRAVFAVSDPFLEPQYPVL